MYGNICLFLFPIPIPISLETINGKFYQTRKGDIFQEDFWLKNMTQQAEQSELKTAEKTDLLIHLRKSEDQLVLPKPCIMGKSVLSQT